MASTKIIIAFFLMSVAAVGLITMTKTTTINPPQEFEYKKHDYICFPDKGVVHSPECHKCVLMYESIWQTT